jgi:hypothetical protein
MSEDRTHQKREFDFDGFSKQYEPEVKRNVVEDTADQGVTDE